MKPPAHVLEGTCVRCGSTLDGSQSEQVGCGVCGSLFKVGPYEGTVSVTSAGANFFQAMDPMIMDEIIPLLDAAVPPVCTESLITDYAYRNGLHIGNPVWEGRADFARSLLTPGGTVLDVGCGFGTYATAMARSAGRVIALDRSPERVAVTAARARAEGLKNVLAIHAEGVDLPLADGMCDLVSVVGVLEWIGVGEDDPLGAQRRLLREVSRVLKPNGQLLLGIENRFGAHYFAAAREEHTGMRFVSLMPRRLADFYSRRMRGRRLDTLTHSASKLRSLLAEVGLATRFAYPFPSYSEPQFTFDEADLGKGLEFYLRHAFHPVSLPRRLAGRLALILPRAAAKQAVPSFWVRASPTASVLTAAPAVITGAPFCDGTAKLLHFDRQVLVTHPRKNWDGTTTQPLIEGWDARRWIAWPLRESRRQARARRLLDLVADAIGRLVADPGAVAHGLEQARTGLGYLVRSVTPACAEWSKAQIDRCQRSKIEAVQEHSDLRLSNVLVLKGGRSIKLIDTPPQARAGPAGMDAVTVGFDVLGLAQGRKSYDLGAAAAGLSGGTELAWMVVNFILRELGGPSGADATAAIVVAVLRDVADNGDVVGGIDFLEWAAIGGLRAAIDRALQ